jgi:hypothetical protein
VLVTEVHDGYVQAVLCSDECDLATETDVVLSPVITGLPDRLLVHGDVSASVRASARELGSGIYKLGPREG